MAQFARPSADTYTTDSNCFRGPYEDTPPPDYYTYIDETVADGSQVHERGGWGETNVYVTKLTSVTDPTIHTGHTVRAKIGRVQTYGPYKYVTVELRQGYVSEASKGTLIATPYPNAKVGNPYTDISYTLTEAEAANITNYADLYFRVVFTTSHY